MINNLTQTNAFAPATVANVAVGFDILGFAIESVGDKVKLTKRNDNKLNIRSITGTEGLPLDPEKNVVSAVIKKVLEDKHISIGLDIEIEKGIPLGSGMGGSAASSVAALVALNKFFTVPFTLKELVPYAMYGEYVASGHAHPDNVVPSLYGGFTLIQSANPVNVIELPVLDELYVTLIHPKVRIDTKLARNLLKEKLPLSDFVNQSANLAGFIASVYTNDLDLMKKSLKDVLIEKHRSILIPSFSQFQENASSNNCIGCSISGSGPSIFALFGNKNNATKFENDSKRIAKQSGFEIETWVSKIRTAVAD